VALAHAQAASNLGVAFAVNNVLDIDFNDKNHLYTPPVEANSYRRKWDEFVALQHGTRLLWLPICFGLGIALHVSLAWTGQRLAFSFGLMGLVGLAVLLRHRGGLACLLPLLLVLAGGLRLEQRVLQARAPVLVQPTTVVLLAKVASVQLRQSGHHQLIVEPQSANKILPALKKVRLTLLKGRAAPKPGDIVEARVRLTPPPGPSLPGGYDRSRRDWFQQIGAQGRVLGDIQIIRSANKPPDRFSNMRQKLSAKMQSNIAGDAGAVAAAMITGDNTPLSLEAERNLQVTSLYHLLSVSGFHLAIITGMMFIIVRHGLALIPGLALNLPLKQVAAIAAIIMAILYTLFTGAAWPTIRSCIGTVLVMVAILLGRQPFSLRLVAFAAIFILVWRPEALVDVSFQFSFAAISGLVAAHQSPWGQWLSRGRSDDSIPFWLLRKLGLTALISLAAETAILPIALLHFHQMGIFGIAANALAAPLVTYAIMPLGLLSAALAPMDLDMWLAAPLAWACNLMLTISNNIAHWPSARLQFPELGSTAFILSMIAAIILLLIRGPFRWSGLPLALCAVGAALAHKPVDLHINSDARQVMLRTDNGTVVVSDERGGAILRKRWRETHGFAPEWVWADGGLGYGLQSGTPRCGGDGCTAELKRGSKTWRIAVFGRVAGPKICPHNIDVMVDGRDTRTLFCTAKLYIDRRWMAAQGVTSLRFSKTNIAFETDRTRRGDRPWARGPWGDGYDQLANVD
jgi:competence protein ComEC